MDPTTSERIGRTIAGSLVGLFSLGQSSTATADYGFLVASSLVATVLCWGKEANARERSMYCGVYIVSFLVLSVLARYSWSPIGEYVARLVFGSAVSLLCSLFAISVGWIISSTYSAKTFAISQEEKPRA